MIGLLTVGTFAEQVYTLTGDVSDPIDLTSMPGFYTDRLAGSASGEVTVTGKITAGEVTPENPFLLIGNGYQTILKSTTGILNLPLKTSGTGIFTMNDASVEMSAAAGNASLYVAANTSVNLANVRVKNDGNPANARFTVAGGKLSVYNINAANFTMDLTDGAAVTDFGHLSLGDKMDGAATPAPRSVLTLTDSDLSCKIIYCSSGASEADAAGLETDAVLIEVGSGSTLSAAGLRLAGYTRSRLLFTGGTLKVSPFGDRPAVITTVGNSNYSPCIFEVEGRNAPIDISLDEDRTLTGGYDNSRGRPVRFTGNGGFVKRGPGTLTWNWKDSDSEAVYTGATTLKEGSIVLATPNVTVPQSPLALEAGTTFDLAGYPASFRDVTGPGTLSNTASATAELTLREGVFSAPVAGAVRVVKTGSGTLTVKNPGFSGDVHVTSGTVRFSARAECGYRYYRFKVDATYGPHPDAMQFSELKLLNGDIDVTQARSGQLCILGTEGYDGAKYTYPPGEDPLKAIDGSLETKWDDFRGTVARMAAEGDELWIRLDYAEPQPITAYSWATANDSSPRQRPDSCRDPRNWRLQGSDDGLVWTDLDVKSDMGPYEDRKTWVGKFPVEFSASALSLGNVRIDAGATLDLRGFGCVSFRSLVNYGGTLLMDDDADITMDGTENADAEPNLDIPGDFVKTGNGTLTLHGTNAIGGSVHVESGTLAVRNDSYAGKYGRVSILKNRYGGSITQISEFSLYGIDGSRVNQGAYTSRADATAASALGEYESALSQNAVTGEKERTEKLFDGNTSTKLCVQDFKPSAENPLQFVFRLPDSVASVTGYSFTTGNDTEGDRNPVSWKIEGSADGVNWVTLDERADMDTPAANLTEYNGGVPYTLKTLAAVGSTPFGAASVKVDAGAVLDLGNGAMELSSLIVDAAAGGGTITRFKPARNGTLYIVNLPDGAGSGELEVPLTIGEIADAAALKSWRVIVDGREKNALRLRFRDGKLYLSAGGAVMLVR
jgi:autotransporter-associated beta strand protein